MSDLQISQILTDQQRHQDATDPLLHHLLNYRFWSFAHDGEGVGVGDGSHRGGTQPRHAEYCAEPSHAD